MGSAGERQQPRGILHFIALQGRKPKKTALTATLKSPFIATESSLEKVGQDPEAGGILSCAELLSAL
jgi:hypothetical protein